MPPLETYIFKHRISDKVTITLEVYGNEDRAWRLLSNYVINTKEWTL